MKKEIPTHDPYTGELNPYYEELTNKKNTLTKKIIPMEDLYKKDKNMEKMHNQKWHQIIELIKSGIRIIGYILIHFDLKVSELVLVFNEINGIVEELF